MISAACAVGGNVSFWEEMSKALVLGCARCPVCQRKRRNKAAINLLNL
jgi:hypothetical protein